MDDVNGLGPGRNLGDDGVTYSTDRVSVADTSSSQGDVDIEKVIWRPDEAFDNLRFGAGRFSFGELSAMTGLSKKHLMMLYDGALTLQPEHLEVLDDIMNVDNGGVRNDDALLFYHTGTVVEPVSKFPELRYPRGEYTFFPRLPASAVRPGDCMLVEHRQGRHFWSEVLSAEANRRLGYVQVILDGDVRATCYSKESMRVIRPNSMIDVGR